MFVVVLVRPNGTTKIVGTPVQREEAIERGLQLRRDFECYRVEIAKVKTWNYTTVSMDWR
jgi:hypothetical protein